MKELEFNKLNVDYTGQAPENSVFQEIIAPVQQEKLYSLQHDIWFADTAIFYTDPNDIGGTRLIKDKDYFTKNMDQIASDQSGQICCRQVQFVDNHEKVFADYHVYGDFVQLSDFQNISNFLNGITTDDVPEGRLHRYFSDHYLSQSPLFTGMQTTLQTQEQTLNQQVDAVNQLTTQLTLHASCSADQGMGHITLSDGCLDTALITMFLGSYMYFPSEKLPTHCVPLLGGVLNPEDFADGLLILKDHVPESWMQADGRIQLPLAWSAVPLMGTVAFAFAKPTKKMASLQAVLTMVTTPPNPIVAYKRYRLKDPETQTPTDLWITLATPSEEHPGIGYNSQIMCA